MGHGGFSGDEIGFGGVGYPMVQHFTLPFFLGRSGHAVTAQTRGPIGGNTTR